MRNTLDCHRATRQDMSKLHVHELQWFVRMIDFASTDSKVIEHKLLQFTLMIPRDNLAALQKMVEVCRREVINLEISGASLSPEMRRAGATVFNLIANEVTCVKSRRYGDISHKLAIVTSLKQLVDHISGAKLELDEVEETIDCETDQMSNIVGHVAKYPPLPAYRNSAANSFR